MEAKENTEVFKSGNTEVFEVLENIEQLHHMEQMKNDESKSEKEPMYMDDFGH